MYTSNKCKQLAIALMIESICIIFSVGNLSLLHLEGMNLDTFYLVSIPFHNKSYDAFLHTCTIIFTIFSSSTTSYMAIPVTQFDKLGQFLSDLVFDLR